MLQDVHEGAQVVERLQLDERRPQRVVQHRAERVHQRRQWRGVPSALAGAVAALHDRRGRVRLGEEVVEQLVLQLAHLLAYI